MIADPLCKRFAFLVLLGLMLASTCWAATTIAADSSATTSPAHDVVLLKNGSVIHGTVVSIIPDSSVRIEALGGNVFVFSMKEVERIVKEATLIPVGAASPASVSPMERRRGAYITPLLGYGALDGYNLGVGVRLGGAIAGGPYLGALFIYHFGKTESVPAYRSSIEATANSLYIGMEIGAEPLVNEDFALRPAMAFGVFDAMASVESGSMSASASESRFFVAPELALIVAATSPVRVELDMRYMIITGVEGASANAFGMFLGIGIRP